MSLRGEGFTPGKCTDENNKTNNSCRKGFAVAGRMLTKVGKVRGCHFNFERN